MGSSQSADRAELTELRREVVALRSINQQLEHRLARSAEQTVPLAVPLGPSATVSRQKVEELVEQMLQNPEINIRYFPDAVERQLYRNVFSLALNVLGELLKTTSIDLMGHRIQLTLVPDEQAQDL
jgi:hypothetical protein